MSEPQTRYTFDRVVRMVLSVLGAVGLFLLLRYLSDVLIPFVAAAVLAYVLNPVVTVLTERVKRRVFAVALTLGGLGIIAFALLTTGVILAAGQTEKFTATMKNLARSYEQVAREVASQPVEEGTGAAPTAASMFSELRAAFGELSASGPEGPPSSSLDRYTRFWKRLSNTSAFQMVGDQLPADFDARQWLLGKVRGFLGGAWSALTTGVSAVIVGATFIVLVAVYLCFLLLDYPEYVRTWREYLPPNYRTDILEFVEDFDVVLRRYLRGQFVVAMLTGALMAVGFSIIGLPMAIPLGLFIGVLNMVPYLQAVGVVPAIFLALMRPFEESGAGLGTSLLLVGVVFILVQLIQDVVLTPRIMGKATGLRPVAILLGVFVWGKLLGLLGLLLAIPLTSLGIAYYRRWVLKHSRDATRLASGGATQEE